MEEHLPSSGLSGLRFHDLRREFASRLLESGACQHEVRDWLGHSNIATTSRYLATTPIALQKAREQFAKHRAVPVTRTPDVTSAPAVRPN